MKTKLLLFFFVFSQLLNAQNFEYVYRDKNDSAVNCYLKAIPKTKKIKGLIVRDYSALPDVRVKSRYRFQGLALKNGFMVLYTVTSKYFPEMYYSDSCTQLLDEIINEVLTKHQIPKENLFIGGISASGTRALRYAQYCEQGKSKFGHKVKGVFAVDSPLDLERFYYSAKNHMGNLKAGMLTEAKMMVKVFPEKLGGTPEEVPGRYRDASVYSATDSLGGNAKYYLNIPIIIFHEPDVDWWINERGSVYYDMNSYDIAGFVNRLKLLGGKKIEMVSTTGKGFDWEGKRNCHSWTIVNEDYLMKWILKTLKQ